MSASLTSLKSTEFMPPARPPHGESSAVPHHQHRIPPADQPVQAPPPQSGNSAWHSVRRPALIAAGLASTALAALGLLLPGLPTTPFLLLAAACFARSSPRLHAALLHSQLFGPHLQHWKQHRSITPAVRWWAVTFVIAGITCSLALGNLATWLKCTVASAAAIGLIVVFRLPVTPRSQRQGP
ncbi:MAG UNVERIFIED_CONTAM: YbaN family protein [Planctomycetaceae bacterium]